MQYRGIFLTIFFCFLVSPLYADKKPVITIAADSWCPINCAKPENRLGVGIELAKAIFEPLGYHVAYKVMPWTEALRKVRAGQVDAIIGASRFDDETLIFPQEPIYNISDDFYVLKGKGWRFQGMHSLQNKKIGVIADYGYGSAISAYIAKNKANNSLIQLATGERALMGNIKELQAGRIDAIVETKPVMEYTIARLHLEDVFEWAGSSPQDRVYLAFSPALPKSKALAEQFDEGMRRLAGREVLDEFYQAYGLSAADR